jgi:hypothetical protein
MKSQTNLKKSQFRPVIAWIIGGFLFISLWALITVLLLIMLKKDDITAQQRARRNRDRLRENYTTVTERDSLGITPAMQTEFEKMLYSKPGVDYPCKDSATAVQSIQRIVKCFDITTNKPVENETPCQYAMKPFATTEIPLPLNNCPLTGRQIIQGQNCVNYFSRVACGFLGGKCEGNECVKYVSRQIIPGKNCLGLSNPIVCGLAGGKCEGDECVKYVSS